MSIQNLFYPNDYDLNCENINLTTINNLPYPPTGGGLTVVAPIAPTDSNGLIISGNDIKLEYANVTRPGIVSTALQDFGGVKAFNDGIILPTYATFLTPTLNTGACINALFNITAVIISDTMACLTIYCATLDNVVGAETEPIIIAQALPVEFRPAKNQSFFYYYTMTAGASLTVFPKHLGYGTLTTDGLLRLYGDACGATFMDAGTAGRFNSAVATFNMNTLSFNYDMA
jgi:hypothetical protein